MQSLEITVEALVKLAKSPREVPVAAIDDVVDAYLPGFGAITAQRRAELADLFKKHAPVSRRSQAIFERILRQGL